MSLRTPSRVFWLAVALGLASLLSTAAAANAAGTARIDNGQVKFQAGVGDTNTVDITYTGSAYELTDSTATLNAGTGCTKTGSVVNCPASTIVNLWVTLGGEDDSLTFGSGIPSDDSIYVDAGAGSDLVDASATSSSGEYIGGTGDSNYIIGGSGPDTIDLTASEVVSYGFGGSGADYLFLGGTEAVDIGSQSGGSSADGGPGDDYVYADSMTDDGSAIIDGGGDDDTIYGSAGADIVNLSAGSDTVDAADGDDFIEQYPSKSGSDDVSGSDGNDTLKIWPNSASIDFDGGAGTDNGYYVSLSAGVSISLNGTADDGTPGDQSDNFGTSVEQITPPGSNHGYNDYLVGSSSNNTLNGAVGADVINGGAGQDSLNGGAGSDTIYAYDGEVDTVTCGTQSDTVTADTADTVNGDCESVTLY